MGVSIAKLGERGTLVEGDMIRLAALDLVLWIVRACMMRVALDLELASMHAGDRAADAARLGIPAHAVVYLEALWQSRSIRCRRKLQGRQFRTDYLSGMSFNRRGLHRFREIVAFYRQFPLILMESGAWSQGTMPAHYVASSVGA